MIKFSKIIILLLILLVSLNLNDSREVHAGLLLEGQISDLGINYNINSGFIQMESQTNISTTKVISSVDSDEKTRDSINLLIQNGFNFIITTSEVQYIVAMEISLRYPQIYFLIWGPFQVEPIGFTPNVGVYFCNLISHQYLLGYLVGLSADEIGIKRIGMVVPGPPTENYYTANAFYTGIAESNKDIELLVVSTNSFNDEDTALGAQNILLNQSIDLITLSQTTMQVVTPFLYQAKVSLGTNGFPQGQIYGTKILQSVNFNFFIPYYYFTNLIINDLWTPNPTFFGDFKNEFFTLDVYSFLISDANRFLTNKKVYELSTTPLSETPYLCNKINLAQYGTECVDYYELIKISDKLWPAITDLGYYAVPVTEVFLTRSINIAFISVSALEIAICFFCFLTIIAFFRHNINFTYSTIPFCFSLLLGASLVGIAVVLWNFRNLNASICNARIWLASLGYTFLIGMIIVKNTLIHKKFNSMIKTKTDKISPIPFHRTFLGFLPILLADLVLLAIYSGIGDVRSENSLGIDGIGKYEYTQTCKNNSSGNITLYIILLFHGVQLLYGCIITWKTRVNDLEEFTEVHDFASSIYLITFCSFIIIPLMAGIQVNRNRNTIISACGVFTTLSCIMIIFGAKFWKIYKPIEDDGLPQIKLQTIKNINNNSANKSSKSKSSGNSSVPSQVQPKEKSINIQSFVNPIESQSKTVTDEKEKEILKEKEREKVQQIIQQQQHLNNQSKNPNNNNNASSNE